MEQNILHINEVDSTNQLLKALFKSGDAHEPFCVYTDYQTEGKGQRGNKWESEKAKNLLCSFLVQDIYHVTQLPMLNLASSLSLIQCLKEQGIDSAKIKWPNDVYIADMKIAGTLIENVFNGSKIKFCVVGIGLNINQVDFNGLNACSMNTISGISYPILEILRSLYNNFYNNLRLSSVDLLSAVNQRLYKQMKSVTFRCDEEYNEYKVLRIQQNGNLLVEKNKNQLELEHHNCSWII